MIITRTPMRIPLGGGGTDLPAYYSQHGGYLLSAAINKYVYIAVNKRFDDNIRVSYSRTEIVDHVEDIQHPIVRAAMNLLGLGGGIEIVSIADAPANTGLGSSSSFTVGLLNGLHTYKRERLSPQELAEEAYHIEVEILGEPIGKQDQYIAAYGGITCLDIDRAGTVRAHPVALSDHVLHELESCLLLFYTGIQRSAADVLAEQSQSMSTGDEGPTEAMHAIKEIGRGIQAALEEGDPRRFGDLMHEHWSTKKRLSLKVSSPDIDRWYEVARHNGAVGGKVMGAGGGGFFLFYSDNGHEKQALRDALAKEGLTPMRFSFDFEGSKVVFNA